MKYLVAVIAVVLFGGIYIVSYCLNKSVKIDQEDKCGDCQEQGCIHKDRKEEK